MANKPIIIITLLLVCGIASAWEIEDVNGTWVDRENYDERQTFTKNYSWGTGKRVFYASLGIDLGTKEVDLNELGLYFIDTVFKNEKGAICLKLYHNSDKEHKYPLNMEISFIDYRHAYIICYPLRRSTDYTLFAEEKWVWYRLSWPRQNVNK
jgi:hypothetical protein